ncbi:VOC family protein [Lentzea aerocolonigenes]|uniref:VOC family protein n=1 Tax=Lentzea aerocolonigenes TaxID=68170 RepID=UPI0004C39ABF|nr:VOC family protein [Lentzea aerocolonigenes]MCP2244438.1 Glyoxalase-like domain-containing protein [Lentzea aerocolonigenes]
MAVGYLYDVVIDCPEPAVVAEFYVKVLGGEIVDPTPQWMTMRTPSGMRVSFQQVDDYSPPQWPGQEHPQQIHLDVMVTDLDESEPLVLALGAKLLQGSEKSTGFRVYADPAGHPFCLVTN